MNEKVTYVLGSGEKVGEVIGKFSGVEYVRGPSNSSFCTYEGKIYLFPLNKYNQVVCLDVESERSSSFFSQ